MSSGSSRSTSSSSMNPYSAGSGAVAGEVHHASLPSARSPSASREQRAERVAVGVLVRDDQEAVVRGERGDAHASRSVRLLARVSCVICSASRQRAHRSASSCGCRARPVGSYSKERCGVLLQPELAREPRLQVRRAPTRGPSSVCSRFFSLPKHRRRTPCPRAGRARPSTPVTVTRPIRGSFSSPTPPRRRRERPR